MVYAALLLFRVLLTAGVLNTNSTTFYYFFFFCQFHFLINYTCCDIEPSWNVSGVKKAKCSTSVPCVPASEDKLSSAELMPENRRGRDKSRSGMHDSSYAELAVKSVHSVHLNSVNRESKSTCTMEPNSCTVDTHTSRTSEVFKEKSFCFSSSFPMEQVNRLLLFLSFSISLCMLSSLPTPFTVPLVCAHGWQKQAYAICFMMVSWL